MNHAKQKRRLKIVAAVRQIYAATDEGMESSKLKDPDVNGNQITCTRGCNACCRMNVLITAAEAITIVEQHSELVKARLRTLHEQARVIEQLCTKHTAPKPRGQMMTEQEATAIADAWWALQLPCPLLLENGDCGVYESRPIPCRTHYVISEPEFCAKVPGVVIGHWVPPQRDEAYKAMLEAWFSNIEHERYPIGSLPKMVLIAYNERRAE